MYNRYIPQPDGSYRRNRIQDTASTPHQKTEPPPPVPVQQILREPETKPCPNCIHRPLPGKTAPKCRPKSTGVSSFLKQLLPKDFDTEDLIVVLLLLLMAGDCQEEQNTALLTLALYLFL